VLRHRVLTALLVGPPILAVIIFAPAAWVSALVALFMVLAAWEWGRLVPLSSRVGQVLFPVLTATLIFLVAWLELRQPGGGWALAVLALGIWLLVLFWLGRPELRITRWSKLLGGWVLLLAAWYSLQAMYDSPRGLGLLLLLLGMVWAADIGAYFAGRAFGRRRLAPQISPGKTWEGVVGGLGASALVIGGGIWWLQPQQATLFFLVGLAAVALSIVGDLLESIMKRQAGVKDSGGILPGHGGILDRIDSLLAAAPLFALGLLWLGEI
jgi:phosphatidate cytidylyltransferase